MILDEANQKDLVEVVRCKDCQHRYTTRCALWVATENDNTIFREHGDDFFCSFGERKDGAEWNRWISVEERLPEDFVSVLGFMTDAGDFPSARECYTMGGKAFYFPALGDVHPVSHWMEMPEGPKEVKE